MMVESAGSDRAQSVHQTVRVPKTAEIIASVLRREIVRGVLPEGSMLPSETALVAQFGVSRPSVREALRVLESEGLVVIQRGARGGGRVTRPEVDLAARYLGRIMQFDGVLLADVWQARKVIEPVAVRLLAERRDRQAALDALQVTLDLIVDLADNVSVFVSLSDRFHEQIVQNCGNETLAIMWGCLKEVIHAGTFNMTRSNPDITRAQARTEAARRQLMALLVAGDGPAAEAFWADQMDRVYRYLLQNGADRKSAVEVID